MHSSALIVSETRPADLSEADTCAWHELESGLDAALNPFLTPTWVRAWYDAFVAPCDQVLLLVRERRDGRLVGVAPMHRHTERVGRVQVARTLLPVGLGAGKTWELPGHLSAKDRHRDVTRSLIEFVRQRPESWATICLQPGQGWFQPEHVALAADQPSEHGGFWQHTGPRACVVLPLQPTWEETKRRFRRNLRESLRRSRNRMAGSGLDFTTHRLTGDDLGAESVRELLRLHRMRAQTARARVQHADSFASARAADLLVELVPRLGAERRASLLELRSGARLVASQLVLHATGSSYLHTSGFDPEFWDYSPVTHLTAEAVRAAVVDGHRVVNFSPGPQESKLRWSDDLWTVNDFTFGVGSRVLLRRYALTRSLQTLRPGRAGVRWIDAAR